MDKPRVAASWSAVAGIGRRVSQFGCEIVTELVDCEPAAAKETAPRAGGVVATRVGGNAVPSAAAARAVGPVHRDVAGAASARRRVALSRG